jgi:hypothetical protein
MQSDPNPIELSVEFSSPSRAGAANGRVDGRLKLTVAEATHRHSRVAPRNQSKFAAGRGVPQRSRHGAISWQHFDGYLEKLNRLWIASASRDRASYS